MTSSLAGLSLLTGLAAPPAAHAAPPRNDNYLSSLRILDASGKGVPASWEDSANTLEATTQADLFNPDRDGMAFGGGPAEIVRCAGTTYANTVWYDFAPTVTGGVELTAAGFDAVIAVYEFDPSTATITRTLACQNASAGASESLVLPGAVRAGRSYTVQVGGVAAAGVAASGALTFGFTFFSDRDGDGVLDAEPDKCPARPGVAAFGGCPPALNLSPNFSFDEVPGGIRLKLLRVPRVPAGARVEARCRSCGLRQVVAVKQGPRAVRLSRFIGRTLPSGSSLELFVTRPKGGSGIYRNGAFGQYVRYRVRGSGVLPRVDRCLEPGSSIPRKVCR